MNDYDTAREQVVLELITEGQRSDLFSASLTEARGNEAMARAIYFERRVTELLRTRR
jgi:hypothetical protein